MEEIKQIDKEKEEYYISTSISEKFAIPFFDFEKSKTEAIQQYTRYKNANPNLSDSELQYRVSVNLINDYAKKTGHVGGYLCLASLIPFIQTVFSFGGIPVELTIITRYNMHLMVKLAIVNNYPFTDDDFIDTLIMSAKTHDVGATVARFILRFIGAIPIIGQIFSVTFGFALCNYINKRETLKFGKNILKEYHLDYEIYNGENLANTLKKLFPWLLVIALACYIFYDVKYKNNNYLGSNEVQEQIQDSDQQNVDDVVATIQKADSEAKDLLLYFKNHSKQENDIKFAEFYKNHLFDSGLKYRFDSPNSLKSYLKKNKIKFNENKSANVIYIPSIKLFTYAYDRYTGFVPDYYSLEDYRPYLNENVAEFINLLIEYNEVDANDLTKFPPNSDGIRKGLVEKWYNKWKIFLLENPDFCLKEEINKMIESNLELINM